MVVMCRVKDCGWNDNGVCWKKYIGIQPNGGCYVLYDKNGNPRTGLEPGYDYRQPQAKEIKIEEPIWTWIDDEESEES